MKRLFYKTMLAAMIVSLVPVQHAQATNQTLKLGSIVGTALLGGFIGKMIGDYACKSYTEESEGQIQGLNMLAEAADRGFDNASLSRQSAELEPGEEGSWTEERTNGYVFGLHLSNDDSHDLIRKVESYRNNLATDKRAETKKELLDTCNDHKNTIQTNAQRNSTLAKYGWPIFGSVIGFIYGWLNK